jgi:hypothetical protein
LPVVLIVGLEHTRTIPARQVAKHVPLERTAQLVMFHLQMQDGVHVKLTMPIELEQLCLGSINLIQVRKPIHILYTMEEGI